MKASAWLVPVLMCLTFGLKAGEPWTLEHSLSYALTHNPDAKLAQERMAKAKAGLEQADSAFWPRLEVQSSYIRTDNPMQVFGSILNQRAYSPTLNFNDVPDVDNLNARGLVTVPLYAGGRNVASRDAAKANAQAEQMSRDAVQNELAFEVVRAYETILKTREFIRAADASINAFEGNLSVAKKRLAAGTLLKSEVLDVEVRLAQARENGVRARSANVLAERALQNLLGIEEGEFVVADSAPEIRPPIGGDSSQRPELASASQREHAAEAEVRGSRSGFLPSLNAFGSLDYDYGWVTRGDGKSYTAGVLARWDLWDGFATRAKVREAKANLEMAREEQRKLRLAIKLEVEEARLNLQMANERLSVTEKSVDQADESASLTRKRFEQGLALSTQLLDAETALVSARVNRAEAQAERQISAAALRKALALPQLDSISQ